MYCSKCGAQNDDGAIFCSGCGERLGTGQPVGNAAPAAAVGNDKYRKVGIVAVVAVIAVIAVIVAVIAFTISHKSTSTSGAKSYEDVVDRYVESMVDADINGIVEIVPGGLIDWAIDMSGYDADDVQDFLDDLNDTLQDQVDDLDDYFGDNWSIEHDILSVEDIDGTELENIRDMYDDMDVDVSAAKDVTVELTVNAYGSDMSNTLDLTIIKVGKKWYLDILNSDTPF